MSKRTAERYLALLFTEIESLTLLFRMEPENDAQKCDEDPQRVSLMLQMLPNEMLIKVFEKLSGKAILNLMLTCKRIYNFVNSSPRILQKMAFKVNYRILHMNDDQRMKLRSFITIMKSCRRFACVKAVGIGAGDLIHLAMLIQGKFCFDAFNGNI